MRYILLMTIMTACFGAQRLRAETWTNVAGHSVEARLVERKGNTLTLKRPDGTVIILPITSLSKASRKAVDKTFPPAPERTHDEIVREWHKRRMRQLERANERRKQRE